MTLHRPGSERIPPQPSAAEGSEARARTLARLADYLAEDLGWHPEHRLDSIGVLVEWCDGDRLLLARARAEAQRDARLAPHGEALALLRLAGRAAA